MGGLLDILLGHTLETPQQTRDRLMGQAERARHERDTMCRLPGPVGATPPASSCFALLAGRAGGANVLFEYDERNRRMHQLTYANERGRDHYRVGDIIMVTELPVRMVAQIFPELGDGGEDDDMLLFDLALGFLGESPPQYRIGWKLTSIGAETGLGDGVVERRGVIFFGENAVELQAMQSSSTRRLAGDFSLARTAGRLAEMIPILEALAQLALDAATSVGRGVARQVGRWTLRGALRVTFRRVLMRRLLRALIGRTIRTTLAASLAFVRGFAIEMRHRQLEARLRERARTRQIDATDLRPLLIAGTREFVKVLLDEAGGMLMERFRRGLEGEDMSELKNRIAAAVAEEVVEHLVANLPGVFVDAGAAAATHAIDEGEGSFDQEFGRRIMEGFRDQLLGIIRDVLARPGQAVMAATAAQD